MCPSLCGVFSAEPYSQLRAYAKVRERPLFSLPRNFTELELQARWFAGDFGRSFTGTAGQEIEIVQFGIWNREAGPDFPTPPFESIATKSCAAALSSILSTKTGKRTDTRPIRPSIKLCYTFL